MIIEGNYLKKWMENSVDQTVPLLIEFFSNEFTISESSEEKIKCFQRQEKNSADTWQGDDSWPLLSTPRTLKGSHLVIPLGISIYLSWSSFARPCSPFCPCTSLASNGFRIARHELGTSSAPAEVYIRVGTPRFLYCEGFFVCRSEALSRAESPGDGRQMRAIPPPWSQR